LFYKKYRYDYIFLALAILLFISQYGYKINSYYVNDLIQFNKLNKLLSENNNLSDKTSKAIRCDISSSIESLVSHKNRYFLSKAMPEIYDKYIEKYENKYLTFGFTTFATKELGFYYLDIWDCRKENLYKENKSTEPTNILIQNTDQYSNIAINILGYDIMYKNINLPLYKQKDSGFKIINKNDKYIITIPTKDKNIISELDITEFINKFNIAKSNQYAINLNNEEMTYIGQNKDMKVKIIFYSINIYQGDKQIKYALVDMLVKYL